MPSPEVIFRHQKAVLWELSGRDDYNEPLVSAPTEIWVRWNHNRSEALDAQGNKIALDAQAVVGQSIPLGSTLALGSLAEWYGTGSAGEASEVMQVITSSEMRDVKGRLVGRSVGLKRFRDVPPSVG